MASPPRISASQSEAIFEWIEVFYNQQRRHSTIGMHAVTYAKAARAQSAA